MHRFVDWVWMVNFWLFGFSVANAVDRVLRRIVRWSAWCSTAKRQIKREAKSNAKDRGSC